MDPAQRQELLTLLEEVRRYVQLAHDESELEFDYGGESGWYESMQEAEALLERINKAVNGLRNF